MQHEDHAETPNMTRTATAANIRGPGHLQEGAGAPQIREFCAGNRGARLEIDQAQRLAQLHVVLHLEVKLPAHARDQISPTFASNFILFTHNQ